MERPAEGCDGTALADYRDDALAADDRTRVEAHLAECAECAAELERLRERAELLTSALGSLDPAPSGVPDPASAAQRLEESIAGRRASSPQRLERRNTMNVIERLARVWRPLAVGGAAAILVALMLSLTPVRHAAAEFLSIFRMEQITVVPVAPGQAAQLEELEAFLDSASVAEPEMLREATEPEPVADLAEAEAVAGFDVRSIDDLSEETLLMSIETAVGPHMRFDIDRPTMELVLAAAGATDVSLPPMDSIEIEVDVPSMVQQTYDLAGDELTVIQMPSPTVSFPPGVPMAQLGEAYLRLLGLSEDTASRMAQDIDWTSTLVMPIPTDAARYEEVTVGDAPGILIREKRQENLPRTFVLIWQTDDVVFMASGQGVTASMLLRVGEALK